MDYLSEFYEAAEYTPKPFIVRFVTPFNVIVWGTQILNLFFSKDIYNTIQHFLK